LKTIHAWTRLQATLIALVVGVGAAAAPVGTSAAGQPRDVAPAPRAPHVIVISIDGLRPDAIERFEARVLKRMIREGAYSAQARTIYPSRTLPSHTSMLTGVSPAVHGVTWNTDEVDTRGVVEVPTVFEVARSAGFSTAAFFSKSKLRHLQRPGSLDHVQAPRWVDVQVATQTVEDAVRYMRYRQPSLLFVHIAEPDAAGHSFGWMGRAYRLAVRRADGAVGQILEAAAATYGANSFTVIVTSDHGGHGRDHGSDSDEDTLIPWLAWGAGVAPGRIEAPVRTMDTAATVLWLLGVRIPAAWEGAPVHEAFDRVVADAAAIDG
jgi:predicted AlkP superfamily pyrophosphatase or phosphodiesterase